MKKDNDYWVSINKVPSSLNHSAMLNDLIRSSEINSIVDFGCGDGKLLEQFSIFGKEQLGIDINESSINEALKKEVPLTNFICSDLSTLIIDKKYDLGILKATLTVISGAKERLNLLKKVSEIATRYLYINDFLQTPSHSFYFNRYANGFIETEELGSFNVIENNKFAYQAHHFTELELEVLLHLSNFKIINKNISKVYTRSGRQIDGIEIIAEHL